MGIRGLDSFQNMTVISKEKILTNGEGFMLTMCGGVLGLGLKMGCAIRKLGTSMDHRWNTQEHRWNTDGTLILGIVGIRVYALRRLGAWMEHGWNMCGT